MVEPNSLVSKILKEKYFPWDFLNSKSGHGPSFVWSSNRGSQEIVKRGTR